MSIWYERVYKLCISTCNGESGLILDDFICHKYQHLKDKLQADDSLLYLIPLYYNGLLQPCKVGIYKPLKDRLKKCTSKWRRNKRATLHHGEKLPAPGPADILRWLEQI